MIDNLLYDIDFPNLFPEDLVTDNLLTVENTQLKSLPSDLKIINDRLENLEVLVNTQSLRIEVERVKRQKLRSSMRQLKHETSISYPKVVALKQIMDNNSAQQNTTNYQLGGEIDRLSTLMVRCLSRMQQILMSVVPCVIVAPDDYHDIMRLLEEIGRTLQQLCVYQQTSYV